MRLEQQEVAHELEVVDFLLYYGRIDREEARYLRDYLMGLAEV